MNPKKELLWGLWVIDVELSSLIAEAHVSWCLCDRLCRFCPQKPAVRHTHLKVFQYGRCGCSHVTVILPHSFLPSSLTQLYLCIYIYTWVYIYICTPSICVYICICRHIYIYIYTCTDRYVYTHAHVYSCIGKRKP